MKKFKLFEPPRNIDELAIILAMQEYLSKKEAELRKIFGKIVNIPEVFLTDNQERLFENGVDSFIKAREQIVMLNRLKKKPFSYNRIKPVEKKKTKKSA